MIHSILPEKIIMEPDRLHPETAPYRHITIQNGFLRTTRDASGQDRIVSLFSTDPYDYLDPRYQPGNPC
jgi:hypothetical protein